MMGITLKEAATCAENVIAIFRFATHAVIQCKTRGRTIMPPEQNDPSTLLHPGVPSED
jgi:hypothetical protein